MRVFLVIYLIFLNVINLNATSFFRLGRMIGGNLGEPHSVSSIRSSVIEKKWFTQILDHSNPSDNRTWLQRYFINDLYYRGKENGPVFLMIGGEGAASKKWMNDGAWIDYAKRFGALLFQVEHRFYGKSHPTENLSTENLRYLTSMQALSDLANFIETMNDQYKFSPDVKWIVFGGSYPGSLAAWMRTKYSHLVHGAMSASGPLLAKVDFKDYFKVVTASLNTHSEECVQSIEDGIDQVLMSLKTQHGRKKLDTVFKLCDLMEEYYKNDKDVSSFFENIADNFAGVVQYNKDNRIGSSNLSSITIDTVCDIMINKEFGAPIHRLGRVNDILLKISNQTCLDYKYSNLIASLRNESWNATVAEGGRQWMYQTCTEFGFYQTSSSSTDIFGNHFPVDFFIDQCKDTFGPEFDEDFLNRAVLNTNVEFGGLDIKTDNIVYVHGSIDPWHALGIIKSDNPGAPAIYIEGTAHCANMYPRSKNDLPQLTEARKQIETLLADWIESE